MTCAWSHRATRHISPFHDSTQLTSFCLTPNDPLCLATHNSAHIILVQTEKIAVAHNMWFSLDQIRRTAPALALSDWLEHLTQIDPYSYQELLAVHISWLTPIQISGFGLPNATAYLTVNSWLVSAKLVIYKLFLIEWFYTWVINWLEYKNFQRPHDSWVESNQFLWNAPILELNWLNSRGSYMSCRLNKNYFHRLRRHQKLFNLGS